MENELELFECDRSCIVYRVIVFMLCYPSSHLLLMFSVQFFQKSC